MTNPTKKQHFVPRFYLKNFANEQGFVHVLDIAKKRLGTPRPYAGVGYAPYFYAAKTGVPDEVSQHIEAWLQRHEDVIAAEMPRIIKVLLSQEQINDDDRYVLSVLMSLFWLRSPGMRAQLAKMEEDMLKQIMRFYPKERVDRLVDEAGEPLSEETRQRMVEMIDKGTYRLEFSNAQHLRFMTEHLGYGKPGFANMFHGMKWTVHIARGNERFITTDSPVVEWCPPPQTFYGPSFLERNKYFALTPEIFLELTYPRGSKKVKRNTMFADDDDKVRTFNMLLAAHSQGYAYSGSKEALETMLAGRLQPGPLELAYYNRYEKPWNEYYAKQGQ